MDLDLPVAVHNNSNDATMQEVLSMPAPGPGRRTRAPRIRARGGASQSRTGASYHHKPETWAGGRSKHVLHSVCAYTVLTLHSDDRRDKTFAGPVRAQAINTRPRRFDRRTHPSRLVLVPDVPRHGSSTRPPIRKRRTYARHSTYGSRVSGL